MDTFNLNFSLCMFEVHFLISPPKTTEDRRYKVFILSLYYQFYTKPSVGIDTIDIWIDLPISAVNHKYVYSFHGTRSAVGGQLVTLASMAITLLFWPYILLLKLFCYCKSEAVKSEPLVDGAAVCYCATEGWFFIFHSNTTQLLPVQVDSDLPLLTKNVNTVQTKSDHWFSRRTLSLLNFQYWMCFPNFPKLSFWY